MSLFAQAVQKEVEEERLLNLGRIIDEKGVSSLSEFGVEDIRLALFFKLCRGLSRENLQRFINNIIHQAEKQENPEKELQGYVDLFLLAFQTRDIDEGKGERQLFYWFILELYKLYPETTLMTLPLIPAKYGSWKDIISLLELTEEEIKTNSVYKRLQDYLFTMFETQLKEDKQIYYRKTLTNFTVTKEVQEQVSLCAKWAPREGRHYSWFSKRLAIKMFRNEPDLYPNGSLRTQSVEEVERQLRKAKETKDNIESYNLNLKKAKQSCYKRYRQTVAQLNKFINTTEVLMCDKEGKWSNLVPSHIPAKCLKIHRNAFLNKNKKGEQRSETEDRIQCATNFQNHLEKALNGTSKVHGKNLMPHEMVKHFFENPTEEDLTLEAQWVDLRNNLKEKGTLGNFVSMVDTSGSMSGTPMMVAIALGILVSECCMPAFQNMFLTFSQDPEWHILPKDASLREKVNIAKNTKWGMNTDFQKALDKILNTCVTNRIPKEEVEKLTLAVFSDMQFDSAIQNNSYYYEMDNTPFQTKYQKIQQSFKYAGYFNKETGEPIVPRILFWNLRGDTVDFPSNANTPGVDMVSGFSANGLKAFMEGDINQTERPTPYQTMRKQLDNERYDSIREVCEETKEIKSKKTKQTYRKINITEENNLINQEIEKMNQQLETLRKQKLELSSKLF